MIKKILRKLFIGKEKHRFYYQKKYIDFNIKKGERVLDIESGSDGFPLATHIADLYSEFSGKKPFTKCDVENMPFQDKEFDFVYCSHVLEHVNDPVKACSELIRVGKRGYIETPTRLFEIMCNVGFNDPTEHKWYVNLIGNSLIFIPKTSKDRKNTGNFFLRLYQIRVINPFKYFFKRNKNLFLNMFLWKNKFDYYIFNKDGKQIQ